MTSLFFAGLLVGLMGLCIAAMFAIVLDAPTWLFIMFMVSFSIVGSAMYLSW